NIAVERADRIKAFVDTVSYVIEFCNALTEKERLTADFRNSLKSLDESGLAGLLKETVDKLITARCRYYYDNSGGNCLQRSLEAIIYEQTDRSSPKFRVDQTEIDRTSLSGGTESVMTVRSLASRPSAKLFGTILLVDEW